MSATLNGSQEATGAVLSPPEPELGHPATPEPETPYCALDAVETFMRRFLAISDEQACVLSLFVAHTYAFSAAESTPYIRITANTAAAGKTRVLEMLEVLVENPWLTGRTTGPAMVRRISENQPTLLLDETDALFSGGNASQQMIRGILNSGYRLGGKVAYAKGSSYEELDVYCPKAFAGIGDMPATLMSRSIPIVMKPRTALDKIERMRARDVKREALVPKMLARRFAAAHLSALSVARPDIPDALDDRAADVWEPLLAIADCAGGEWPSRARSAAVSLCATRKHADTSETAYNLLSDCRDAFSRLETDRLKTVTLLETLLSSERWQDLNGVPLDAMTLASSLRPFAVAPKKIRMGRQVCQGYMRFDVARAWEMLNVPDETEVEV